MGPRTVSKYEGFDRPGAGAASFSALTLCVVLAGCSGSAKDDDSLGTAKQALDAWWTAFPEADSLYPAWADMRSMLEPTLRARRATGPVRVDGRLEEADWERAQWSEPFVEIRGGPADDSLRTRVALLWDDERLLIAARMADRDLWATFREDNLVMYWNDDFEVFIDPDGDRHRYYELEVNTFGRRWELTLERPYVNGGPAIDRTNIPGVEIGVHVEGTLNDPSDRDSSWSVEIAIPWSGLARYTMDGSGPRAGDTWRMAFARVDWRLVRAGSEYLQRVPPTAVNLSWSAQGIVDMHRPELWGFVRFEGDAAVDVPVISSLEWTARRVLMGIHYRQAGFHARTGRFAGTLDSLGVETDGCGVFGLRLSIETRGAAYGASASSCDQSLGLLASVDETGRLSVERRH